jgi:predicted RNase H-like HicB family nuclease
MRYAIVIENAGSNYSAHVPDLPGYVATSATVEETERSIREAIELHVEGMREDGTPIPPLSTIAGAGRDTLLLTRRERWKTVCARGASLALVPGRSTSPLGVTFSQPEGNDNESRISDYERYSLGCCNRRVSARRGPDSPFTDRVAFAGDRFLTASLADSACRST